MRLACLWELSPGVHGGGTSRSLQGEARTLQEEFRSEPVSAVGSCPGSGLRWK